jgi:hypothetical protein
MASRSLDEPHPSRLTATHPMRARIIAAHAAAMAVGEAAYLDPAAGLLVLTPETLAARRDRCHNGCRHYPHITRGRVRQRTHPADRTPGSTQDSHPRSRQTAPVRVHLASRIQANRTSAQAPLG